MEIPLRDTTRASSIISDTAAFPGFPFRCHCDASNTPHVSMSLEPHLLHRTIIVTCTRRHSTRPARMALS